MSSTDLYLRHISTSLTCGMGILASECPCKHCRRLLSDVDTSQGLVLGSKREEGNIVTRLFTPKSEIPGQKSLKPFEFTIDLKEYKWLARLFTGQHRPLGFCFCYCRKLWMAAKTLGHAEKYSTHRAIFFT